MRVQQIQHLLRFAYFSVFANFSKTFSSIGGHSKIQSAPKTPCFYKICYTILALQNSKIYLVKTVAKPGIRCHNLTLFSRCRKLVDDPSTKSAKNVNSFDKFALIRRFSRRKPTFPSTFRRQLVKYESQVVP